MLFNIYFIFVSYKSIIFVVVNFVKKYIVIIVIVKCFINVCFMYIWRIGIVNNICYKFKKSFVWLKMVFVMNIRNILVGKEIF